MLTSDVILIIFKLFNNIYVTRVPKQFIISYKQCCSEGVLWGSVAPWKISSGKNLKVKFNPLLIFWKFSELAPLAWGSLGIPGYKRFSILNNFINNLITLTKTYTNLHSNFFY